MKNKSIFVVCTGLGKVSRGFENYIAGLSGHLSNSNKLTGQVTLFTGGTFRKAGVKSHRIPNISNTSWFSIKLLKQHYGYVLEQLSFFFFFFPIVCYKKPAVIYLGEYLQYCFLFKVRKWFKLSYSLAIYTGGQVYPGLYNPLKDFVHHVTPVYLSEMSSRGDPESRQFLIPHFITGLENSDGNIKAIKEASGKKKIVLSVGLIDCSIKRMDFMVKQLAVFSKEVFPIILGQHGPDTSKVKELLELHFGAGNYLLDCVPFEFLGNFYGAADLFILCSLKESFGLVLLEALDHNLPVMCHSFEESRYVMQNHAHFVNMESGIALQKAINNWLETNETVSGGHQYVQSNFSWQALEAKYVNMFNAFIA